MAHRVCKNEMKLLCTDVPVVSPIDDPLGTLLMCVLLQNNSCPDNP